MACLQSFMILNQKYELSMVNNIIFEPEYITIAQTKYSFFFRTLI